MTKKTAAPPHAVTAYAQGVVAGLVPAGSLVVKACQRHLDDLKFGAARGLTFSEKAADRAILTFGFLRHYKGEWAGRPIVLDPWQKFVIGCGFGWLRADGTRRFRTFYIEVPRKNGKSTLGAGIALVCLLADDEPGAEIYSAATKRDQARIVFDAAGAMVRKSPELARRIRLSKYAMQVPATESFFVPIAADATTADGGNPHCAIVDEVHAHPSPDLINVLESGVAARRQPLIVEITTAGLEMYSVCRQHHDYSVNVLDGLFDDTGADEWFAYIAAADVPKEADTSDAPWWMSEDVWRQANPAYGVSVKPEYFEGRAARARNSSSFRAEFLQKNLNIWAAEVGKWLDMEAWKRAATPFDAAELKGRRCYVGIDLAKVRDLSAVVLLFPPDETCLRWRMLAKFYVPEVDIDRRSKEDRIPYRAWCDAGYITATPGKTTDYDFIEADIIGDPENGVPGLMDEYEIAEVVFDPAFGHSIMNHLVDAGLEVVEFRQGYVSLGAPTAEFERMVIDEEIEHGGNPVMTWCASNAVVSKNPTGDIKPDKEKAREKIDGISAAINALGRAWSPVESKKSYLEDGEMVLL